MLQRALRRAATTVAVSTVLLAGVTAAAGSAAAGGPGVNPADYCRDNRFVAASWDGRVLDAYWIPLRSQGVVGQARFPILSLAGCVSSVAVGMGGGWVDSTAISVPAAREQCAWLEQRPGFGYPTRMFGSTVHNRTACAHALLGALARPCDRRRPARPSEPHRDPRPRRVPSAGPDDHHTNHQMKERS
jgi:hypothetical protein